MELQLLPLQVLATLPHKVVTKEGLLMHGLVRLRVLTHGPAGNSQGRPRCSQQHSHEPERGTMQPPVLARASSGARLPPCQSSALFTIALCPIATSTYFALMIQFSAIVIWQHNIHVFDVLLMLWMLSRASYFSPTICCGAPLAIAANGKPPLQPH